MNAAIVTGNNINNWFELKWNEKNGKDRERGREKERKNEGAGDREANNECIFYPFRPSNVFIWQCIGNDVKLHSSAV